MLGLNTGSSEPRSGGDMCAKSVERGFVVWSRRLGQRSGWTIDNNHVVSELSVCWASGQSGNATGSSATVQYQRAEFGRLGVIPRRTGEYSGCHFQRPMLTRPIFGALRARLALGVQLQVLERPGARERGYTELAV